MDNKEAVGMLATIGSTLTNSAKIELKGISSAGMYGEDSDLTNSTTPSTSSQIFVNKEASAGMYAKNDRKIQLFAKISKNEGTIENKSVMEIGKSAAMYSHKVRGESTLTTKNSGTIKVAQEASAGIYVKNESGKDKNTFFSRKYRFNKDDRSKISWNYS